MNTNDVLYASHQFIERTLGPTKSPCRELTNRYDEPHRVYHGRDHIAHMLTAVDEMVKRYSLNDHTRCELHLATWLHDAVYVVGDPENEINSASLALVTLRKAAPGQFYDVWDMVMATKKHDAPRTLKDAIIIDADLCGLGSKGYFTNKLKVLRETFGLIGDKDGAENIANALLSEPWREGRTKFLEAYLNRPTLFFTSWGAEYELPARHYMETELRALKGA